VEVHVAAFCDEHLRGTRSHIDKWRESLNRDVLGQLGHAGPRD
jgi:DNA-binding ferritin-like protein (Dps family)